MVRAPQRLGGHSGLSRTRCPGRQGAHPQASEGPGQTWTGEHHGPSALRAEGRSCLVPPQESQDGPPGDILPPLPPPSTPRPTSFHRQFLSDVFLMSSAVSSGLRVV